MQQAIDKQKHKCFNAAINDLKSSCSGYRSETILPKLACHTMEEALTELKQQREDFLQQYALNSINHHEINAFDEKLYTGMSTFVVDFARQQVLPQNQASIATIQATEEAFNKLHQQVSQRFESIQPRYQNRPKYAHWRGADVIITADTRFKQKQSVDLSGGNRQMLISGPGDADVVVVTANPYPLVWMIYQLRDSSGDYLNAGNKYRFYGEVAASCQSIAGLSDGTFDEQMAMLTMVAKAEELVREDLAVLVQMAEEFHHYGA